jgi:flavodoxin
MKKTLIVFHSRTGHTKRVAQALAQRLDADLDEIRIVQPLDGIAGYTMCAIEAMAGLAPALRPMHRNATAYELVVIGTPVWFWSLASPVRSWLEKYPLKGRVAFFCTMGGSGSGRVFTTMAELAGRAPVATLAFTERQIDAPYDAELDTFARQVGASMPRPARRPVRPHAQHAVA